MSGRVQDEGGEVQGQSQGEDVSRNGRRRGAARARVDEDKAKGKEKAKVEEYQDQVGRLERGEGSEVMWAEEIHPVTLAFEDVSFTVKRFKGIKGIKKGRNPLKRNKKEILHPMSGHFVPGRLATIMGEEKSILLRLLASRLEGGKIGGKVTANEVPITAWGTLSKFRKYAVYVPRDDSLLCNLTPRMIITAAARLRLPRTITRKQRKERARVVIKKLGLQSCQDRRVIKFSGKPGVTPSESRRVSIGQELLTNPSIMFVDELTSGLDHASSEYVVQLLRELAREGRTIICTLREPSSAAFAMFDDLFLIAGGTLVYSGPVAEVPKWFKKLGYPVPKHVNPAEHVIRVVAQREDLPEEYHERIKRLAEYREANNNIVAPAQHVGTPAVSLRGTRLYKQFWILGWRCFRQYVTDSAITVQRLISVLMLSILIGLMFLQIGYNVDTINNRTSVLFFSALIAVFTPGAAVIWIFPRESPNFIREYSNSEYSVTTYYIAKSIADTPFNIFFPIIYCVIIYWMVGLKNTAGAFFTFMAFIVILSNIGQSLAFLFSIMLPLRWAVVFFPLSMIPFVLVGGLFLNVDNIIVYFIWLQYISFVFWGFVGLSINEFRNEHFYCTTSVGCVPLTGEEVLSNLNFEQYEIWQCVTALAVTYVILRVLAILALWILAKKKSGEGFFTLRNNRLVRKLRDSHFILH